MKILPESPPDFDELTAICDLSHLGLSASELQGQVVGLHVTGTPQSFDAWLTALCATAHRTAPLEAVDYRGLENLYQHTAQALLRTDLDFQLLLPSDERPMGERLVAVSQWIHGFMSGMTQSGIRDEDMALETREVVSDLLAIGEIETELEVESQSMESEEKDYVEIVEYIRVAVLLLQTEWAKRRVKASV